MKVSSVVIRTLDESIRPFLAEGRAGYHFWLSTSTFFVAVGVMMEVLELFKDVRDEVSEYLAHRRHRLILNSMGMPVIVPNKIRFPWVGVISAVGWFMVAAGVAGEFQFDHKVSDFDATLQVIDNDLLAQAGLDAATADKDAGNAVERAGKLEVQAATLRKQSAVLELSIVRLKTPRNMLWNDDIRASLCVFSGSPYSLFVFPDQDSIDLAGDVRGRLDSCKWAYKGPPQNASSEEFVGVLGFSEAVG